MRDKVIEILNLRCLGVSLTRHGLGADPTRRSLWRQSFFVGTCSEVDADEFFVVAGEHMLLGEGWMTPDKTAPHGSVGRFDGGEASEFFVGFGSEFY